MARKVSKETFIERSNKLHSNRYDYSLVEFEHTKEKVQIICPKHGQFEQEVNRHMRMSGCFDCGQEDKAMARRKDCRKARGHGYTLEEFLAQCKEIHQEQYDYSLITDYKNLKTYYRIICPIHDVFEQTGEKHLMGRGCVDCGIKKCGISQTLSKEEAIRRFIARHGATYDYSRMVYTKFNSKIEVYCPAHQKSFWIGAQSHAEGTGCPDCYYARISHKEKEWLNSIGIPNDKEHRQVRVIPKRQFTVDGFDPETNTVYEFYGDIYHGNPKIYDPNEQTYWGETYGDLYKKAMEREELLRKHGYTIVSIWESDFNSLSRTTP